MDLLKQVKRHIESYWDDITDGGGMSKDSLQVCDISVENTEKEIIVTVELGRPGLLIGKAGRTIYEIQDMLTKMLDKKTKITIKEKNVWR